MVRPWPRPPNCSTSTARTSRSPTRDKVYFPTLGLTKLDLVHYYLAVADGALRGGADDRWRSSASSTASTSRPFYQKRAPEHRPEWIETVEFRYPSGRIAHEIVLRDAAQLAWVVNLGCVDLHPHAGARR